jgi:hypothetical protein
MYMGSYVFYIPLYFLIMLQNIDQTLTHEMDTHYNNLNKNWAGY